MTRAVDATELEQIEHRMLELYFTRRPFTAAQLGIEWGRSAMPPVGAADTARLAGQFRQLAGTVATLDTGALVDDDRRTALLIGETAGYEADLLEVGWLRFTVSPLPEAGIASQILTFGPYAAAHTDEAVQRYLDTCAQIPGTLAAASAELASGRRAGDLPVARLVRAAARQLDGYLDSPPAADRFVEALPAGVSRASAVRLRRLVDQQVRPAFRRYRRDLADHVLPGARSDRRAGLCWLPGGPERYQQAVRAYTTMSIGPQECHTIGLEEVARLRERAEQIGASLGWEPGFDQIRDRLRGDPTLRFRDAEQILDAARDALDRAVTAAPAWVIDVPTADCAVMAMDPLESPHGVIGHYETAPLDRHRPARYWVNVADPPSRPRYEAQALAFHESMPGHHLEIATSQERRSTSEFRRLAEILPYTEGWALYAEGLADEMGLYSTDLDRLGMISFALWRASRLVVDTGLHADGWSRQRAVDYLLANTMLTQDNIGNEVDRYLAHPGSALGYHIGRLAIEHLRGQLVRGVDPDQLRRFHTDLLNTGPLTMTLLAEALGGALPDRWCFDGTPPAPRPAPRQLHRRTDVRRRS